MADATHDETNTNQAAGISGFGGHLLTEIPDGITSIAGQEDEPSNQAVSVLASLGIEDAEQLIAVASIAAVREELHTALGLKTKDMQALLNRVREMLPAERAALVSAPASADFGLGVLPATPEMIAAAESSATAEAAEAPVALPASVNLIPFMSPIRNQASRGTCVSFALTALNEYIKRRSGVSVDLSEQHLYYETKLIDGSPSACGTWQARAVIALLNRGECLEQIWPYNPNPPCNTPGAPPAQARPDGLHYRLTTITVPARNVVEYKTHMSKQRPVTVSIPVYDSWYRSAETARSGRITMRIGNEPAVGGHAVCLVGYQDTPSSPGGGYFIIRNSWSTSWASASPYGGGYGTIPYQYITNDASEAFSAQVPGITQEGDVTEEDGTARKKGSTVVIDVSPGVKITISAT